MKTLAPWLLVLFFMLLFIVKTFECISLSHTLTRLGESSDRLQEADQRLQDATKNLMTMCRK